LDDLTVELIPKNLYFTFLLHAGIYHYLGSWESYSYREDARDGYLRSYDKWHKISIMKAGGSDDYMRPWIGGFIKVVGEENARYLLQDAGLPRDYRNPRNVTSSV